MYVSWWWIVLRYPFTMSLQPQSSISKTAKWMEALRSAVTCCYLPHLHMQPSRWNSQDIGWISLYFTKLGFILWTKERFPFSNYHLSIWFGRENPALCDVASWISGLQGWFLSVFAGVVSLWEEYGVTVGVHSLKLTPCTWKWASPKGKACLHFQVLWYVSKG